MFVVPPDTIIVAAHKLPYEFLRVYSPSAEVRGHGPGQEVLQVGKKNIEITKIDPVGTYVAGVFRRTRYRQLLLGAADDRFP